MTHQEFIDQYLENRVYNIKDGVLYVTNWLDCHGDNITSLPVDCHGDNITSLPEKLWFAGSLNLYECNITSLPEGLYVGGVLDLRRTKITSLPEELFVGWSIFIDNKISMTEKAQLNLISQYKLHFNIIESPTEKAISLQKLLWEI